MEWTRAERLLLQSALRRHPASMEKSARWRAIADDMPSRTPKECLAQCRLLAAALRASLPPPLLRAGRDELLLVLERLDGGDLCSCACTCGALREAAHDEALWRRHCDALPPAMKSGQRDGEPRWSFCLRVRFALHGDWHRLHEHRAGRRPYLQSLGKLVRERRDPPVLRFEPEGGALPTRVPFGAVCELAPPAC